MLFLLQSVLLSGFAHASDLAPRTNSSCLPVWTALQTSETFDTNQDYDFSHPLDGENSSGRYQTKVVIDGHYSAQTRQLILKTHFDDRFNGVSLPYNLFAVLAIEAGEANSWQDFTKSCTGPGVGFYPGQVFQLPTIKFKGDGKESVQIMVWGFVN